MSIYDAARGQQRYVVGCRRELHRIPELRWEETETLARIENEITAISGAKKVGAEIDLHVAQGGIWVDVTFDASSLDRILFRADVDALPISEATGLPFASEKPGNMHA